MVITDKDSKEFWKLMDKLKKEKMTEENFFDMFNRIHNPDYYYGKKKNEKKKTQKKKEDSKPERKPYPVFKISD
jgi:hypothetical protein